MKLILLIFFAVQAQTIEEFFIEGKKVKIFHYPEHNISLSKECKKIKEKLSCNDLSFLDEITLKKAKLKGTGGRNPGAMICSDYLKAEVFIGIDSKK